jgi:hypothetical protein
MAKKLERTDFAELDKGMQEQGYSPGTRTIVMEQVEKIEPGQEELKVGNVIFVAVMRMTADRLAGRTH